MIPGGVNSTVRAFKAVGGNPVFVREAKGAYLTDVDGNRYLDYVLSWGPMIAGHAHPAVVEAVQRAAERVAAARELGLRLVPRLQNDERFRWAQISALVHGATDRHDAHTVIFFGLRNAVLGYPDNIDATANALRGDEAERFVRLAAI